MDCPQMWCSAWNGAGRFACGLCLHRWHPRNAAALSRAYILMPPRCLKLVQLFYWAGQLDSAGHGWTLKLRRGYQRIAYDSMFPKLLWWCIQFALLHWCCSSLKHIIYGFGCQCSLTHDSFLKNLKKIGMLGSCLMRVISNKFRLFTTFVIFMSAVW